MTLEPGVKERGFFWLMVLVQGQRASGYGLLVARVLGSTGYHMMEEEKRLFAESPVVHIDLEL